MRTRMMNNRWRVVCFLLIFYKFIEIQASVNAFLTVAEALQKFYLTPSTYIVSDIHDEFDFKKKRYVVEMIKRYSRRGIMSQSITFNDLKRLSDRRENTLYSLIIQNRENLEHAINITKDHDMSVHPWFLYIRKATNFNCNKPDRNFFQLRIDTWMSAMCVGDTTLKSYHGVLDGQIEVVDMAHWAPKKMQLEFKHEKRLIKSHIDSKGITLRLAARMNRSVLINNAYANIEKFNYELIDEVANLSNFKTKVVAVDSALGYINFKTNKWYGMMKLINDNVIDIGIGLFTLSHTRMRVVDYTIPLAKGRRNLYVKLPNDTEVLWSTYFKVFNNDSWTVIGVSIFVFSILLCIMKNGLRRISIQLVSDDFLKIWGIFSMQSQNDTSSSVHIKIIYFSILFTSLILNMIYSASITSVIAVLSPELPFNSYSEFLRDKSYQLVVLRGSREHGVIMANKTFWTPLRQQLKQEHLLPNNSYEGFRQACEGKVVYFTDEVIYNGNQNYLACKLGAVNMVQVDYMSFIMTKNHPYLSVINYNILRLMDYGILNRLREKYFQKYNELSNAKPNVITLKEIWSIIIIWAVGLTIAVTGLLLEIIIFRFSLRNSSMGRTRQILFCDNGHRRMIVNKRKWSNKKIKLHNSYQNAAKVFPFKH